MDCREARIAIETGRGADARAHLETCESCRAAAAAVRETEAVLARIVDVAEGPDPSGASRTKAALGGLSAPRRRPLLRIAAAALFVVASGAAGWLLRGAGSDGSAVSQEVAVHELRVFEEVRAALGGRLSWLATVDGEVVLGISGRGDADGPLQVVLLEIQDGAGAVVARPRFVVPSGKEVEVDVAGAPRMRLTATAERSEVACAIEFPDGMKLTASSAGLPRGERSLLSQVTTDGQVRTVHVTLF